MTPALRSAVFPFVTFTLVFATGVVPMLLAKHGLAVAPIWPANGLALMLAVRSRLDDMRPAQFCLAITAAIFLANVVVGNSRAVSTAFTAGNLAEIGVAYAVIRWSGWQRRPSEMPHGHTTLMRVIAASIMGPAVGAIIGAVGLMVTTDGAFGELWLHWALSSALSMMIVAAIGLALPIRRNMRGSRLREVGYHLAFLLAGAVTVVPAFATGRLALLILTAPVIIAAAIRLRSFGAAASLGMVSSVSLVLAGDPGIAERFHGVFSTNEVVLLIQVYLVTQGVIALALAAYLNERDALKNIIRAQREMAKNHAELRLRLLMNIAHEIRTPLNVVQGCSELLAGAGKLTVGQKELLDATQRAATQLQHLAVDLLDASRIESGLISFAPDAFDPRAALEEIAELARRGVGRPDAILKIDAPDDLQV